MILISLNCDVTACTDLVILFTDNMIFPWIFIKMKIQWFYKVLYDLFHNFMDSTFFILENVIYPGSSSILLFYKVI